MTAQAAALMGGDIWPDRRSAAITNRLIRIAQAIETIAAKSLNGTLATIDGEIASAVDTPRREQKVDSKLPPHTDPSGKWTPFAMFT